MIRRKNKLVISDVPIHMQRFGETIRLHQKQTIYSPDKPANSAFYLVKGCVEISDIVTGTKRALDAGQFFGDRSIFSSNTVQVETLTDVEYIQIDEEGYKRLLKEEPGTAMDVISKMSQTHQFEEKKQESVMKRIWKRVSGFKQGLLTDRNCKGCSC